jgi:RNA polymerase sigma-70 factor (ECF subfamily)
MEYTCSRAFESELATLFPTLVKLARRFADRSEADDLVQEACARALERRSSLREGTDLRAWMRPVIRNLAIDAGRKRKKLRPLEEAGVSSSAPAPAVAPAWSAFTAQDVRGALLHCPKELRITFELHYWEQLPLDRIASQLGVPRATVGTRLFRARAHVRRELERGALEQGV